jgi:hypothetical protein
MRGSPPPSQSSCMKVTCSLLTAIIFVHLCLVVLLVNRRWKETKHSVSSTSR